MADDLDRLESENHDLRQEVQQQRQPKPTKYDKLQLEFDGLKSELYISRDRSESLEERVKFLESEQAPDHERETTFTRYRAEISSLRASRDEWMGKYTDLQGAHRGAVKRIKELEAGLDEDSRHRGRPERYAADRLHVPR